MINVAVIGFGFMGITHAINILRNKNITLQAIITRHPQNIDSKLNEQVGNFSSGSLDREAIGRIATYTTLRDCVKNEKIDAVHICVHSDLHYDMAREAIDYGLHVLLEKPMCLRQEEAKLLIHLAHQKKVTLMVAHVVRFMPAYVRLKQWIDDRSFGPLEFISLTRFTGVASWGQWKEKQKDFGSSGGALFDLVIHDIDFLNYVMGGPGKIKSVCYPGKLSMQDYVSAYWQYGDVYAKIEGGNTFHSAFPFQAGFMARFENASVNFTSMEPGVIQVCTNEERKRIPIADPNEGFYNEIDYFASCIENNTEPLECMPESSLQTIRLCYDHL